MAVIGNLSVSLTAKTAAFTKKLGKVSKSLGKMVRKAGAMGVAFGAAAVAGIAFFTKKAFASIDATAKLADTLELTTEQLIGYQKAAKISGGTTEDVSKGFTRMLKNVSDAGMGLTTAQHAFEAFGINAEELKSMGADEIFKKISDEMGNVSNISDKIRAGKDLFGRSFQTMMLIAKDGAEGIRKFQQEVLKTGEAFNRIDAAKVEAANDAIERAGGVLQGVINKLAIKLAPFIEAAATGFRDLALETNAFGTVIGDTFTTAVDWMKIGSTAITRLQQGFSILGAVAAGSALAIVGVLNQVGLGLMQIVTIEWNLVKAMGQGIKTVASMWYAGWKGMQTAFFSFVELAGTTFANFIIDIGVGISSLAPGVSKSLLSVGDSILGAVQANSKLAKEEFGGALDALKKNASDTKAAFSGMLDGVPTKGPLHGAMVGLAERTGELIGNVKTLEEDNSKFLGGVDQSIANIQSRANKAAEAIKKAGGDGAASTGAKDMEQRRQSDFKQVNLSRFVLNSQAGSTVKKQKVEAPEFKDMVRLLQQIADGSGGGAVVQ